MRHFGEAQSKVMSAYAQSGQYHTIVESLISNNPMTIHLSIYIFASAMPLTASLAPMYWMKVPHRLI